jgi:alanyl-tRNA synthetase
VNAGLSTEEIRQRFLRHFVTREHTEVPSASLIAEDPTLLLVNAGMVPFKPFFLGERPAPFRRAVSVQKCVRTVDIELVGTTNRHGSFFQMCGNFSFGDYFKERAIPYAWEFVTGVGGLGLPADRLWVTVYHDDDEAAGIWTRDVGLDPSRVQRRGREDNYWSMGVPGPCGPCSEIFWDRGPQFGRDGGPVADEDRYTELWNLVFMQYERGQGQGKDFPVLRELPARNIDTGMGLERVACVMQGVESLYDIDINRPVLERAGALAGVVYEQDPRTDVRLRVVGDHTRTAVMLLADGVVPSNEGRGYVLRRMLRRAVRTLRLLGVEEPAMGELVPVVRDSLGPSYPVLVEDFDRILGYAAREEEAFRSTLRSGTTIFDTAVAATRQRGGAKLSGQDAFRLHDTYGFPVELTLEMAAEAGLSVDEAGFRGLMVEQQARAKKDTAAKKGEWLQQGGLPRDVVAAAGGPTAFTGYEELSRESQVAALVGPDTLVPAAGQGEEVGVVLDVTPFYAEGGGQQADTGRLIGEGGAELEVIDVARQGDLIVHRARVVSGELRAGETVLAQVNAGRRAAVSRSHTATHLIHEALRRALGDSATQAGSLNAPGRLRFDFANPSAVPQGALADVEDEVNARLAEDLEVRWFLTGLQEARRLGAMALFTEKYGDEVRVVEVGDYTRELCAGTHAARSGQLGVVTLLGEASIGAGVRRVEALVGLDAFRFLARERLLVERLSGLLKAPGAELPDRVGDLLERLRAADRALGQARGEHLVASAATLGAEAEDVAGVLLVSRQTPGTLSADDLRRLALAIRDRLPAATPVVVALVAPGPERAAAVVAVNDAGRAAGLAARELIGPLTVALEGKGGGRDDVAQGGGSRPDAAGEALAALRRAVANRG